MTQTSDTISILWAQLAYILPTVLVSIAALVVCVVNWKKAPMAAVFCMIGFGLMGLNSIVGAFMTTWMVHNGGGRAAATELWSVIAAARIILNMAGLVFVLVAVFSGRNLVAKQNLFETGPSAPPNS